MSSIENELREFRAAALDESLFQRLEACAEESWMNLDPIELHLEHRLRSIAPSPLSPRLTDKLETTLSAVPYPTAQPKIVSFHAVAATTIDRKPKHHWWSAAASVALFGALAGWLLPNGQNTKSGQQAGTLPQQRTLSPNVSLVPAGINRGLSQASDEGVVLQAGNQPHRVLKFIYNERVMFKDAQGRTYHVDQPRVEYIMVPTKTD